MSDSLHFYITESQRQQVREWWVKIVALYFQAEDMDTPFYPGSVVYKFTSNGVGTEIEVEDTYSGEVLDITDSSSW